MQLLIAFLGMGGYLVLGWIGHQLMSSILGGEYWMLETLEACEQQFQ